MALLSAIRRWHFREGIPIREIERRTGLSRNTSRKYLRSGTVEPKFKVPDRPSKLARLPRSTRTWCPLALTVAMAALHRSCVAWKADRQHAQQTSGRGTFVPLVFAPGEAFQFDWSEDWAINAGKQTKLQVAHAKLSHSRAFAVRAYLLQTHEMLFDALTQAFRVLGGVPQRGIFDNMKTAVDRIERGRALRLAFRRYDAADWGMA